jgi:hypothetical protein
MTSQSPRIYIYKITFEEVFYYYYGVKKEKYFNQEYWGSPVTNKWCWEFYTPKKQILQFFEYSDEGYIEAQEVEKRIISPVLNDKWCLNENVGGIFSINVCENYKKNCVERGKKLASKIRELKIGIFAQTKEEKIEAAKKGGRIIGNIHKQNGTGVCGMTTEQRREVVKKSNETNKKNKTGLYGLTFEQRSENGKISGSIGGKISGKMNKELGRGICGLSKEELSDAGKKGGKITGEKMKELKMGIFAITPEERSEISKKTANQKWMCTETGHISNAAGLSNYQRARDIDTSKRIRIE